MSLNGDDLEKLLRQNLNLRRQLGAQVAKAKDKSAGLYAPGTLKPARGVPRRSAASARDVVPPFETKGAALPEPASLFHRQGGGRPSPVGIAKSASDNDELEGLRRELTLRRLVAAEVPKAENTVGNRSGKRSLGAEETAETASSNEDLGELRRQLKLRRERAEITKAKDSRAKQGYRIAYKSWVLYGASFAMAGVSAFLMLRLTGDWRFDDGTLIAASISAFVFYGVGRDLLYALSGR